MNIIKLEKETELEKEIESIKNLLDLYESEKKIISYNNYLDCKLFYVLLTQKQYDNLDFKVINNRKIIFEIIRENNYDSLPQFDCDSFEKDISQWFYNIEDCLKSNKYDMNLLCIKEVLGTVIDKINDHKSFQNQQNSLSKIELDAVNFIKDKISDKKNDYELFKDFLLNSDNKLFREVSDTYEDDENYKYIIFYEVGRTSLYKQIIVARFHKNNKFKDFYIADGINDIIDF